MSDMLINELEEYFALKARCAAWEAYAVALEKRFFVLEQVLALAVDRRFHLDSKYPLPTRPERSTQDA